MAGAVIQQCPSNNNDEEDICARLAREIDELINRDKRQCGDGGTHGLRNRFREQIEGANGPGTEKWDTHDKAIREQQQGLRDRLNKFDQNNCGSRQKIPEDAWKWATRPAPSPKEWKGPAQQKIDAPGSSFFSWKHLEEATGLTGAALVIYVIISEGSRLFPARNLVPVL